MAFTLGSCARGFAALTMLTLISESSAAGDNRMDSLTWILITAAFLAFFAAWGIGANDVANTFATSVGAKSVTVRQAVVLASIFEFLGAVTMGSQVAKTMRKGIADVACFEDNAAHVGHDVRDPRRWHLALPRVVPRMPVSRRTRASAASLE